MSAALQAPQPKNADTLMRTASFHISNVLLATKKAMETAKLQSPAIAQVERLSTALDKERTSVLSGQRDPADWVEGAEQSIAALKAVTAQLRQRSLLPSSVDSSLDVARAAASEVKAQFHEGPPGWLFPMGALVVAGLGFWAYQSMGGAQMNGGDEPDLEGENFEIGSDDDDDDDTGIEVISKKRVS